MTREEAKTILRETSATPNIHPDNVGKYFNAMKMAIEALEQQPKTGHWIPWQPDNYVGSETFTCSYCRRNTKHPYPTKIPDEYLFCPYCGTKMEVQIEKHDCRDCKIWLECPNGMRGHIEGTSIGFSIGECVDFIPKRTDT